MADRTDFKVAVRLKANDFAASLDGAAVVTDTSGTLPTVTTIHIGMDSADDEWNDVIKVIKLWNIGKPNAFLISETTTAANDNAPVMFADNDNFEWRLTGSMR